MARTLFTFLFENLPPTLFLLNLHWLVMQVPATMPMLKPWPIHRCKWCFKGQIHVESTKGVTVKPVLSFLYRHKFCINPWFCNELNAIRLLCPVGSYRAHCSPVLPLGLPFLQGRMGKEDDEDLMHLRIGKRLAFAKCVKNTK